MSHQRRIEEAELLLDVDDQKRQRDNDNDETDMTHDKRSKLGQSCDKEIHIARSQNPRTQKKCKQNRGTRKRDKRMVNDPETAATTRAETACSAKEERNCGSAVK